MFEILVNSKLLCRNLSNHRNWFFRKTIGIFIAMFTRNLIIYQFYIYKTIFLKLCTYCFCWVWFVLHRQEWRSFPNWSVAVGEHFHPATKYYSVIKSHKSVVNFITVFHVFCAIFDHKTVSPRQQWKRKNSRNVVSNLLSVLMDYNINIGRRPRWRNWEFCTRPRRIEVVN